MNYVREAKRSVQRRLPSRGSCLHTEADSHGCAGRRGGLGRWRKLTLEYLHEEPAGGGCRHAARHVLAKLDHLIDGYSVEAISVAGEDYDLPLPAAGPQWGVFDFHDD